MSNSISSDFLSAAMSASPDRLREAMALLKGEPRQVATPPAPREPFKTLAAVSREINICRATLWRYRVPGYKHAGRMRYRTSEVLAYLDTDAFAATVKALKQNGWRRPTDDEIERIKHEVAS